MDYPGDLDDISDWFRIPSSSSSFFALATLDPPSPTPSPTSSTSSIAFEELPIFFVDSVRDSIVDSLRPESSFLSALHTPSTASDSTHSGYYQYLTGDDSVYPPRPILDDDDLSFSESMDSSVSYGTFGEKVYSPMEDIQFAQAYEKSTLEDFPLETTYPHIFLEPIPEEPIALPNSRLPDVFGNERADRPKPYGAKTPGSVGDRIKRIESNRDDKQRDVQGVAPLSLTTDNPARKERTRKLKSAPPTIAPTEFVWLHGVSIDLLIDQEGFRSATPSFRYSGVEYTGNGTCTVTFKPHTKQAVYFHYHPFDSLPILRRVTVNGEETRDYISKQAQLTLKSNGVYSVHGAEVSSLSSDLFSPHSGLDKLNARLEWEFQYVVSDRVDNQGHVVDAERKFAPLAFICSPWLLHPTQGKRINLVHMLRKGVAGKLTAEKFLPPTPLAVERGSGTRSDVVAGDRGSGLGYHRRAHSHAVGGAKKDSVSNSPIQGQHGYRNKIVQPSNEGLRRRASSVGVAS